MPKTFSLFIFLTYSLLLIGLITLQGPLLALAIPFVLYLAVGLFHETQPVQLKAERVLSSDRVLPNTPVTVTLNVTNEGPLVESLIIEDIVPSGAKITQGLPYILTSLKSGATVTITYTITGSRGQYAFLGYRTLATDHLGLVRKHKEHTLPSRFLVLPTAHKLPEVAIRPRRTRVFPGLIPARKGGPGVEFFGLREYQSGDPMRWINDRASARHDQTLFVNEFEQERAADVGLLLDCRIETNLFHGSAELLEHSTQATATLAESFLNYGNRVGLLVFGGARDWIHPGYGKVQRERILQALAAVQLYDSYVSRELANIPARLFPARSQLVMISSLLYQDLPTLIALRAHGYPLMIISPDPISFESSLLGNRPGLSQAMRLARLERDLLLRQLRRTSIRVVEWQVDQPFQQAARFALSQRFIRGVQGVVHA
ncbi:MAG: DUF58 domain-containing protein [Anaerolineales bacterium]|nr:DUF58 domain-containing protein [Anaerolineales bacterium]